jgi:hypothetical protein
MNTFPDKVALAGMVVTQVLVDALKTVVAVVAVGEKVICEFGTLRL